MMETMIAQDYVAYPMCFFKPNSTNPKERWSKAALSNFREYFYQV